MSSLAHVHLDCATQGCYAVITVHPREEARLRETHETFYCPAGHRNYFAGKSERQKRIEQLERLVDQLREERSDDVNLRWEIHERLLEVARAATVCPLGCGWRTPRRLPTRDGTGAWAPSRREISRFFDRVWGDLREHLIDEHNATLAPIALLEAGDAAA